MSKAALKKELLTLSKEQLVEVVLDAYSASKPIKEYFEFFLNPDGKALLQKKFDILARELSRSSRGRSKARISVIRTVIKDFAGYGVERELVFDLIYNTIRMIVGMERYYYYPDALTNGALKLTSELISIANELEMLDRALQLLKDMEKEEVGRPYFREKIMAAANNACQELKTNIK